MSFTKTFATTGRVLKQLWHDPRTIALILLIPTLLLTLLKYVFYDNEQMFDALAPILLGIFPLIIMFLVTSVATLRERTSGTLDRLMTAPLSKLDIVFGYAIAFSLIGFLQACLTGIIVLNLLGVTIEGSQLALIITAILASFLGTALGLFVSAFARNEFQAVQLVMPIIMPQVLLCGLFVPRDKMADVLEGISNVLPLSYSVDAMKEVTTHASWTTALTNDLIVVFAFGLVALLLGSVTIRRQE